LCEIVRDKRRYLTPDSVDCIPERNKDVPGLHPKLPSNCWTSRSTERGDIASTGRLVGTHRPVARPVGLVHMQRVGSLPVVFQRAFATPHGSKVGVEQIIETQEIEGGPPS